MRFIILFVLCVMAMIGRAQEQVSDVYFDEVQFPLAVDLKCGFHSYNGNDYITIDNDSLQIYEMNNDELSLMYIVHKPKEFAHRISGNISSNTSQKNIEEQYYYFFFQSGIYIVDIEEGAIFQSLDLSEFGYRLAKVFKKTDDQIYFYGFHGESKKAAYFRYDVASNEIFLLDAPIEPYYYVRIIENTIYYNDESLSRIMGYDLLNDSSFIKYQYEGDLISNLRWGTNLGEGYLTFRDESGFKIIHKNLEVTELNCNFENLAEVSILELKGDKAVLGVKEMGRVSLQVYNTDNCDLLQEFNIDNTEFSSINNFNINEHIVEDYSIVSYRGNAYAGNWKIVIDHTSNTKSIDFNSDYVMPNAVKETINAVYWNEYSSSGFYGLRLKIMRYDKISGAISSISPYQGQIYRSSLGISKDDEIYFAANDIKDNYKIWKTVDGDQFTGVKDLDFKHNLGVETRYDICVDGETVVSNGIGGLMTTDESTNVISSGSYKRDIALTENYIATIVTEGDSNFVLKYDKQTGASSKFLLNIAEAYQFSPVITDKFIFNTHKFTILYFDIENEELKFLTHNSPSITLDPWRYYPSADKMIISEMVNYFGLYNYYFFDFKTQGLKKIDYQLPEPDHIAISDNNAFYFNSTNPFNQNEEITRVKDGEVPKIIFSGDCYNLSTSSFPAENGEYVELFFKCQDEILIVSDDGESTAITSLPLDEDFSPFNTILYKNKDEYLLKNNFEGERIIYLFNAPNSLVEVNIPKNEEIITTSFDLVDPLIITNNEEDNTFNFYLIDKQTGALELKIQTTDDSYFVPIFLESPHAISNTQYVVTSWHDTKGYELFEIDLENQKIELKVDLYEGKQSSSPHSYTKTSDYLYFIAKLEKDGNQWFRIKTDMLSSNQDIVVESLQDLLVFPNPSSSFITMDKELKNYSIYSSQGQEVLSKSSNDYDIIDISQFPIGHYIISGIDNRGLLYASKFVKVE